MTARLDSGSFYSKCHQHLNNRIKEIEDTLSRALPLEFGQPMGIDYRLSMPLVPGMEWTFAGWLQCYPLQFIYFTIAGKDASDASLILAFTFSIYDARGSSDVNDFLDTPFNGVLVFEYTSPATGESGSEFGVHAHKETPEFANSSNPRRWFEWPYPELVEPDHVDEVFDFVVEAVKDPDAAWDTLVIPQVQCSNRTPTPKPTKQRATI